MREAMAGGDKSMALARAVGSWGGVAGAARLRWRGGAWLGGGSVAVAVVAAPGG